jgi:predicted permease
MAVLLLLFFLNRVGWISKDVFIISGLSLAFGSHAFFGVAFFETLYGGQWLDLIIITASILGVLGIVISIMLFEYGSKQGRGLGFLRKVITNPLVISIFLGLAASLLELNINVLKNTLNLLGKTAGGVAIFSLGIFIHDNFSLRALRSAAFYSIFRSLALPVFTYAVILFSGISDSGLNQFLFLQSGIPAAISLVVFAERYRYKIGEVAGMVIFTSLLSFPVLTGLFYLSQTIFP